MNLFNSIDDCKIFTILQKSRILSIIKKNRIIDLLTFLPKKSVEIILVNNYLEILNQYHRPNVKLVLLLEIEKITNLNNKQFIVEGRCYNAQCKLIFFKIDRLLYSIYKPYTNVVICGKVDIINNIITLIHPIHRGNDITNIPYYEIEINYCSNRVKNLFLKKRIYQLLDHLHQLDLPNDWIPLSYRQEYKLPTFIDSIKGVHGYGLLDINMIHNSLNRIILDEIIFYNKLIRQYQNTTHDNRSNRMIRKQIIQWIENIINSLKLPFTLTNQQKDALQTIFYDMECKPPLFRLLQGDVGCGKTIVALIISCWIAEKGYQVVLLSPSLTLANQHYDYFKNFLPYHEIILLTSQSSKNKQDRQRILSTIASTNSLIIIGTHSLLSESIQFKKLGLIIFDEHHKFGVNQRSALTENFQGHILSMTATPNPRTMMLAEYKFLDLSIMSNNKSNNRITYSIGCNKINKIIEKVPLWLHQGEKIYWVCSKVHGNHGTGTSCIDRHHSIEQLNVPTGIIHGQMDPIIINETLDSFKKNIIKILVCTTVIEVGIDIKDATIIIIENAEMFGISQLHQLRGRVGRGDLPGKCLLIYNDEKDENVDKIEKFVTMESGFEVSNLDLSLRGPGDLLGTSQKGKKNFKFIDKCSDKLLFSIAADIAPHIEDVSIIKQILDLDNDNSNLLSNKEYTYLKKN